jgi:N-acetyl sugar amidotransferase
MNDATPSAIAAERPHQRCTRCVMDTTAPDISFNERGECNYCSDFLRDATAVVFEAPAEKQRKLQALVERVKRDGRNKPYDCIVGVSGGVDSSWTLVKTVELGLRPLAVHMDNGWNSELAQNNIANLVRTLGVDLHTHVINWQEYRQLMQAFFDADVIDVELLYDNAMLAVNNQQARKYNLGYILSGSNTATEGMPLPEGWNWYKRDKRNILAIARRFGSVNIKTFPIFSTLDYLVNQFVRRIKWVPFLDYIVYDKEEALNRLEADFGYKRYPFKHYESVFTRFYQGYILPQKFNVDKRLTHLSTLVMSKQMSREDALAALEGIAYESQERLDEDLGYFLKKMGWSRAQLDDYLQRPGVPHSAYPTERPFKELLSQRLRQRLPIGMVRTLLRGR